jgi:hypothetical protein
MTTRPQVELTFEGGNHVPRLHAYHHTVRDRPGQVDFRQDDRPAERLLLAPSRSAGGKRARPELGEDLLYHRGADDSRA